MLAQSRVKTDYPDAGRWPEVHGRRPDRARKGHLPPAHRADLQADRPGRTTSSRDEKWKSNDGQDWDIPRLIKEELAQPIVGAACGGTHRLTGFSYAVRKREQRKEPIDGQWLRAKKFVEDYHDYTFRLQNPDGSFSTEWFVGRGDDGPPSRRLETTGHITEWLAYSLNDEEVRTPR